MKAITIIVIGVSIALGSFAAGYKLGDNASKSEKTSILIGEFSNQILANAAVLQTFKQNRLGCTRWLLQTQIKSAASSLENLRNNPYASKQTLIRLEKAVSLGQTALTVPDKSGVNELKDCT